MMPNPVPDLDQAIHDWYAARREYALSDECPSYSMAIEEPLKVVGQAYLKARGLAYRSMEGEELQKLLAVTSAERALTRGYQSKTIPSDHKHPKSKGGTIDPDNLQTLCRRCNSRKGAKVPQQ